MAEKSSEKKAELSYEKAVELVRRCTEQLDAAEKKILELTREDRTDDE